jgi:DNA-binding response OmpR family regulator
MARLLLVEDNPDQLELRRLIFEHAGHRVWTASSPQAALDAFGEARPSVVVTDLHLPRNEDGVSLIRALRRSSSEVRIVVLSGAEEGLETSAARALADHYLRKPVCMQELLSLIRKLACDSIGS